MRLWLISLNESLNLKRPLKPHQIDECAIRIVAKYRHVTISDINLIFNRAKEGEYGEFYESISIPKVLSWFKDYFDERCEVAASMSQMEHERIKYNSEKVKRVGEDKEREMHKKAKQYYINKMKNDYGDTETKD